MKLRRKERKGKLHEQWVKHADLPPEVISKKKSSRDVPVGREKDGQRLRTLYILLALVIFIFILLVASVLLFVQYY